MSKRFFGVDLHKNFRVVVTVDAGQEFQTISIGERLPAWQYN